MGSPSRTPQPHLRKPLLRLLPIHHIPNRIEILRLPILILQVIRMLPRIDSQQRNILPNDRILIRVRSHFHRTRLRILDQPRPPTALNPRQFCIHHLLQPIESPIRVVDCGRETARGASPAAGFRGREVLPEKGVIEVAAAVEVDEGLQGDFLSGGGGGVEFLGGGVVAVYVGLVVLRVVELHYLPGDGGFEGGVVIYLESGVIN